MGSVVQLGHLPVFLFLRPPNTRISLRTASYVDRITTIGLGTLLLLLPAIYNGYPFVYNDDATYLSSGFELETPFDRPITYGLFLRLSSLNGFSLWPAIVIQALILSWLVHMITCRYFKVSGVAFIGLIGFLTAFTSAGWVASQLMPDIFTAILLLSLILLALDAAKGAHRVGLYMVFFLACCMHLSHLTYAGCLLVLLLAGHRIARSQGRTGPRTRPILIMLLLTGLSILTMGSALSKSRSIFFMGAMVEHGILKAYLDAHCPGDLALCSLKDSLPHRAYDFVWGPQSPVERLGGWKVVQPEFSRVIKETLTEPKYLSLHVKGAATGTVQQLQRFRIGDGWGAFRSSTPLAERLARYVPGDANAFASSRQNIGRLAAIGRWHIPHTIVVVISLFGVIAWLLFGRSDPMQRTVVAIVAMGIFLNAMVCGTFANAIDRLGAKMIWLLPAIMGASLLSLLIGRANSRSTPT